MFAGGPQIQCGLNSGCFSSPRKGSTLEGSEVRRIIVDYAKRNNLVDADNKK